MIIDIHNHPDWLDLDVRGVLANMDHYHIDVTWMLSLEGPQDEYDQHGHRAFLSAAGEGSSPCCRPSCATGTSRQTASSPATALTLAVPRPWI